MAERSARPGDDRPGAAPRVEVPLAGEPGAGGEPPTEPDPNWRLVAGLSALAGIGLGIVITNVLLVAGGDDESAPATTPPPSDTDTATVTAPETLPPIETEPTEPTSATVAEAPAVPELVTEITVPSLDVVDEADAGELSTLELGDAVAALGRDEPRRSTTRFEWGDVPIPVELEVLHDPVADRDRLTITADVRETVVIVDHETDTALVGGEGVRFSDAEWIRLAPEELLSGTGLESLRDLTTTHLLGPVRPDTLTPAAPGDTTGTVADDAPGVSVVRSDRYVALDDGSVAACFTVTLPTDAALEWVRFVFRPIDDARPDLAELLPESTAFEVYASADGVELVSGFVEVAGVPQSFTHRIETLPEPIPIELPDDELVFEI